MILPKFIFKPVFITCLALFVLSATLFFNPFGWTLVEYKDSTLPFSFGTNLDFPNTTQKYKTNSITADNEIRDYLGYLKTRVPRLTDVKPSTPIITISNNDKLLTSGSLAVENNQRLLLVVSSYDRIVNFNTETLDNSQKINYNVNFVSLDTLNKQVENAQCESVVGGNSNRVSIEWCNFEYKGFNYLIYTEYNRKNSPLNWLTNRDIGFHLKF